jgi:hypothetical protein
LYILNKYSKNLPRNPNANSTRKLRWNPNHQHPGSPAPAPPVAGMASTSGRDQVNCTPVAPVSAPIPAIVPAQVSVPSPALPSPSAHVISTSQVMAAKDPSPQTSSDLSNLWLWRVNQSLRSWNRENQRRSGPSHHSHWRFVDPLQCNVSILNQACQRQRRHHCIS